MLWRLIKNNSNPPLCAAEERLGKIFTAKKILPRIHCNNLRFGIICCEH